MKKVLFMFFIALVLSSLPAKSQFRDLHLKGTNNYHIMQAWWEGGYGLWIFW